MKRLFALLLVFLLLASLAACSPGDKEGPGSGEAPPQTGERAAPEQPAKQPVAAPSGDAASPAEEEGALIEGEFYRLEELKDIVAAFKELEYTLEDGGAGTVLSVSYLLKGQETVGGAAADHIVLNYVTDGQEMKAELWLDKDGNPLKSKMEGMELGQMESSLVTMSFMGMLMPFTMYASAWEDVFLDKKGYQHLGWSVVQKNSGTRNLGAGDVKVEEIKFAGREPGTNRELEFQYEIAIIGGKAMFIGWEAEVGAGGKVVYRANRLVPR